MRRGPHLLLGCALQACVARRIGILELATTTASTTYFVRSTWTGPPATRMRGRAAADAACPAFLGPPEGPGTLYEVPGTRRCRHPAPYPRPRASLPCPRPRAPAPSRPRRRPAAPGPAPQRHQAEHPSRSPADRRRSGHLGAEHAAVA